MTCCSANGILSTGASPTKRLALSLSKSSIEVVTLFIVCAVVIRSASDFQTCNQGIALHASGANANGFVGLNLALGISATGGGDTRINTLLSHASLGQRAIVVDQTFVFGKKV